ncbi:DNA helicase UvrD [Candidatus Peregrinibacteria bacterium]|nr:DNA helicase UvrD [Candidatus Peregrinibacteria bacterium]
MFIADLHIHSKYSRACSRDLDLPHLEAWAKLKGIDLISTGDFTYPAWFRDLHEKLEEREPGVFALKAEFRDKGDVRAFPSCEREIRFILTTEVSLIYKKKDRVRKVHLLILAPNLGTVAKINVALDKIGNIRSDGRPILGLDSKVLLRLLLDISPDIQVIPAHIWTPHFSVFGANSGFDSIEECFEELSPHICALETGLSSDPAMNWRLSQLDKYVLVSNSDAHSPRKLGREATVFDCARDYPSILNTLRHDHSKVAGTIEFFPEEGKYHADGLRDEQLRLTPEETRQNHYVSPKTGKKITVGVDHRVSLLADRPMGFKPATAREVWYIIPLAEIVAEALGVGPSSKKVDELYYRLLERIGPEFFILKDASIPQIATVNPMVTEAIDRMRKGRVIKQAGYDGEFGVIKLFSPGELVEKKQMKLL